MSNVGESTENYPIEFYFSIYKGEYLRHLPSRERNLKLLTNVSNDWVKHSNYIRFQPYLGWVSPKEFR